MSESEVLRRAAGLMRERAEAAVEFRDAHTRAPLPWHGNAGAVYDAGAAPIAATADGAKSLHIASWHPAVALAVADWLDLEVLIASDPKNHAEISREALAVARAYLGADQ